MGGGGYNKGIEKIGGGKNMNEKKKHKIMLGIEVVLLCMIVAILGTNAASSNPPSNGVSYGKNNQTTVEGALNDLYTKANYGNATASQILKGKTALVGGKQVTGTIPTMQGTGHVDVSETVAGNHSQNGTSYLYYKVPPHTYTGEVEWLRSSYADVASRIGLTAGKLLKGQTVLGITGTGETSCPTCPDCPTCPTPESQGYWKVKTFSELTATCSRPNTSSGCSTSWFTSAKDDLKNCNSTSCEATNNDFRTYLTAALDFEYNEILGYNIVMTCPNNEKCIRYSTAKSATGGADKTTSSVGLGTQGYSYRRSGISTSFGTRLSNNIPAGGFNIGNNCDMDVVGSVKKGEVGLEFVYNCYSNGAHWSNLELKGTSYLLSGYIIYK